MTPPLRHNTSARGFGAIELVVISVVLGGAFLLALKGRVLVAPARAYVITQQIKQYQSAVLHYQNDFRALPGDDLKAPTRWKRSEALYTFGLSTVSLAGDGKIDGFFDDPGNASGEQYMAWQDLRKGGYVEGDATLVGQSARPENMFDGVFGFAEDNLGLQQVLCITKVPGRDAELVDKKLDDGNAATGLLRGTSQWDPVEAKNHFSAPDTGPYDPDKTYIICLPNMP